MNQKERIEATQITGINFNKETDIIRVSWINPYIGFGTFVCSMDYDVYDSEGMGTMFEEFIISKIKEEKEKLLDDELAKTKIISFKPDILNNKSVAEDLDRILDANEIYAILTDGFGHDVTVSLKISKVRSRGVQLEQNQYDVSYALFNDYKKSWALTRKELE